MYNYSVPSFLDINKIGVPVALLDRLIYLFRSADLKYSRKKPSSLSNKFYSS
jgi:hypothetical protein